MAILLDSNADFYCGNGKESLEQYPFGESLGDEKEKEFLENLKVGDRVDVMK